MLSRKDVTFFVGDVRHTVKTDDVGPETTLNTYLREHAYLTGTKRMCLEGGCGSCTIAVEEIINGSRNFFSVNSCLVSIFSCHGWKIHTIEGIGNPLTGYNKIQQILAENYGTQCGFCSPGMVMNMFALQESGQTRMEQIENSFGGNICRCTGYRPILHAFKKLATDNDFPDIEELNVCPAQSRDMCMNVFRQKEAFIISSSKSQWMRLHVFRDLLELLKMAPKNYILVCGNSARGVYKQVEPPELYLDIREIAELSTFSANKTMLRVGGNVTLTEFINICNQISNNVGFAYLKTIAKHVDMIASVQIRNVGTLAGNLMIKYQHNEFPSDIFLLLETFNAVLVIVDTDSNELFRAPSDFLKVSMSQKVIKSIIFNTLDDSYKYSTYKIMPRAQNAHALINAGFLVKYTQNIVKSARIVYGGINPQFVHAANTEKFLVAQNLYNNETLQKAFELLDKELNPDHVLPDPSIDFKKNLAISLFYKFVIKTCPTGLVGDRIRSGGETLQRPLSTGIQDYSTKQQEWPLTQPIPKVESLAQTSGQIQYVMDMPALPNEVHAAFVTAKAPAGSKIQQIDPSEALNLIGVIAFYNSKDVPGKNVFTPLDPDMAYSVEEELFCSSTVQYYYQSVGLIVAKTEEIAWQAAELVKVKFTPPESKVYVDVRDVVKENIMNRITHQNTLVPKEKGKDIKKIVKGEFYIGQQYHFHMETQGCRVIPLDDGGIDIFATTQWMDSVQRGAVSVLNMPSNKINVKVKRLGGAFGGKIVRNTLISSAAALAAVKLQLPVKLILPFEQNMNMIGKRYPLYMRYEAGVNAVGLIQYLTADLYSDIGAGGNEPFEFMLFPSFENCYDVSTWEFSTYYVKTDTPPNCYTRAPGTLESTAAIESIMEHIAYSLNLDPISVKLANCNMQSSPNIPEYWNNLKSWADIERRKNDIETFNKENRWMKRGISIVPMRWILDVPFNFSVLVSVFHGDGGVTVSHGGIEMGQGINTKVIQVCAYKFGIEISKVSVKPSCTYIAPNSSASGGSLTSEAICYAVITACDTILERMKPVKEKMENPNWIDVVNACFAQQIQLCATGFFHRHAPQIQSYPIFGIGATTVEVDVLTGKHEILQVDIIEDLGQSMSPLVDIGQIEGAFVMGIGYFTLEELVYDSDGKLYTNRTWNYKPPGAKDIPINFRVKFAEHSENPVGVLKSKAVAEPPTCLSVSVALAIRNAIFSARKEADASRQEWIEFNGPTTVEKTFLYSLNNYKQYVLK